MRSDYFNSLDKIIVSALCDKREIAAVELHEQYRVSPLSIIESASRLASAGIADFDGIQIVRSRHFVERLTILRHQIYNRDMPWKRPR